MRQGKSVSTPAIVRSRLSGSLLVCPPNRYRLDRLRHPAAAASLPLVDLPLVINPHCQALVCELPQL